MHRVANSTAGHMRMTLTSPKRTPVVVFMSKSWSDHELNSPSAPRANSAQTKKAVNRPMTAIR
ncbi:hypothetical protein D3I60_00750 [Brevibacterium permense]|nr:hypothetical protein [Brevibacterium permense]